MQMTETNLAQAVEATSDVAAAYDTNMKYLLADKQILARILKYAVEEFKDMPIEEIMESIGDDIEIGTKPIEQGLSKRKRGETANSLERNFRNCKQKEAAFGRVRETVTEDNVPGEGKIFYDIRFTAYHKREEMKFLINVEAQKSSSPAKLGYHLENRIIFYLARMISAQKQTEFYHSDYDDLKKVRSIWICMDSGENNDSIEEIRLDRKAIFGNVPENLYDVDLLRGIMIRIRIRKNVAESKNVLISMLENLLSQTDVSEKKRILEERYGMIMTTELEGKVNAMCNWSEGIAEMAREEGIEQGRTKIIADFLSNGGSAEDAVRMLNATEAEIAGAKKLLEND